MQTCSIRKYFITGKGGGVENIKLQKQKLYALYADTLHWQFIINILKVHYKKEISVKLLRGLSQS